MSLSPPPAVKLKPVTRTDFVRYAGASGDFNPLHHDVEYARSAGLPDVMAQGMYSAGLVATALETWHGEGALTRFSVRFRQPVWPGDRLEVQCDSIEPGVIGTFDLTLSLRRDDGDVVLSGTATVRQQEIGDRG